MRAQGISIPHIDDILYGGSSHDLVSRFAEQISNAFKKSLMGELDAYKQGPEGTFVHQCKYMKDILKKFDMWNSKHMSTPMATSTALDADEEGEAVDQTDY